MDHLPGQNVINQMLSSSHSRPEVPEAAVVVIEADGGPARVSPRGGDGHLLPGSGGGGGDSHHPNQRRVEESSRVSVVAEESRHDVKTMPRDDAPPLASPSRSAGGEGATRGGAFSIRKSLSQRWSKLWGQKKVHSENDSPDSRGTVRVSTESASVAPMMTPPVRREEHFSTAEEIYKLNELRKMGALSDDEFQSAKQAQLAALSSQSPAPVANAEQYPMLATEVVPTEPIAAAEGLAPLPFTVPDLPTNHLERMREHITSALLDCGGKRDSNLKRVAIHGFPGVGKTTMAIAVVYSRELRASFDKVVWVNVGQVPDIRTLQDLIHHQLCKQHLPKMLSSDADVLTALRDAARGSKVLLVLDDVWDATHEKQLCCCDMDTESSVLVTSRVSGLLNGAVQCHLDVLSKAEGLELLLSTAGLADANLSGENHQLVLELVEICGRLPLCLCIIGGTIAENEMVAKNGDGLADIMGSMRSSSSGGASSLRDEYGMRVSDRVFGLTLKMVQHLPTVMKVFLSCAVFPEDAVIPVGVFDALATDFTGEESETEARLAIGECIGKLLRYNLLKGSLSNGRGIFIHDLVREYLIEQHTATELRALQQTVVASLLAARPVGGFASDQLELSSFESYVGQSLFCHMHGAVERLGESADGVDGGFAGTLAARLAENWMRHPDSVVRGSASRAIGCDATVALADALEAEGKLISAAYALSAATMHIHSLGRFEKSDFLVLTQRLLELLARVDDATRKEEPELEAFEYDILNAAFFWVQAAGASELRENILGRMKQLTAASSGVATPEDRGGAEIHMAMAEVVQALGFHGGGNDANVEACLLALTKANRRSLIVAQETSQTFLISMCNTVLPAVNLGAFMVASQVQGWGLGTLSFGEKDLVKGVDGYDFYKCGRWLQQSFLTFDPFRSGNWAVVMALEYGNLESLAVGHQKIIDSFQYINAARDSKDSEAWYWNSVLSKFEVLNLLCVMVPLLLLIGQRSEARAMLDVLGFGDACSFNGMNPAFKDWMASIGVSWKAYNLSVRLLILAADGSQAASSVSIDDLGEIPSPVELAEAEREDPWVRMYGAFDLTSCGAVAFRLLGRNDDAYELAKIAVSPGQKTEKSTTLVACRSILGQISAERGNLDESEGHFAEALRQAKRSRLPMMELLAARDWKKHVLEPSGLRCDAAEAAIDEACAKMKKTRDQLATVLAASGVYSE